jgi:hypothetical protein
MSSHSKKDALIKRAFEPKLDVIIFLVKTLREQKNAPRRSILQWLEEQRLQMHKSVAPLFRKASSKELKDLISTAMVEMDAAASDARLGLLHRDIHRLKRNLTRKGVNINTIRNQLIDSARLAPLLSALK